MDIPEVVPAPNPNPHPGLDSESPESEQTPTVPLAVGGLFSNSEFQERVEIVMSAIEDPEKYRRCVAEIHTYLSLFEQGLRQMQQEMMTSGGPMTMMRKMMMGR